jgi:hypothetical protein
LFNYFALISWLSLLFEIVAKQAQYKVMSLLLRWGMAEVNAE